MRMTISAVSLLALLAASNLAAAEDKHDCGSAAESTWLSVEQIKARFSADGTEVRQIKVEDGCYEIYAVTKGGAKVEQIVNPVTGLVVGQEGDD